jgi:hypothetical protein
MDNGDILLTFGTFCVHLVHFSGLSIMYKEKSGNPAHKAIIEGLLPPWCGVVVSQHHFR